MFRFSYFKTCWDISFINTNCYICIHFHTNSKTFIFSEQAGAELCQAEQSLSQLGTGQLRLQLQLQLAIYPHLLPATSRYSDFPKLPPNTPRYFDFPNYPKLTPATPIYPSARAAGCQAELILGQRLSRVGGWSRSGNTAQLNWGLS